MSESSWQADSNWDHQHTPDCYAHGCRFISLLRRAAGGVEVNVSHWQSDRTKAQEREFQNRQKMRESSRLMAYHKALRLACGGDKQKAADFMDQAYDSMSLEGLK